MTVTPDLRYCSHGYCETEHCRTCEIIGFCMHCAPPKTAGLRQLIETAQAAQPDSFKPELGYDLRIAADRFQGARSALHHATAALAEEVRLARSAGMSVQDCARLAGVTRRSVYKWIAKEDN